jgi:NAD(P)-dependent dehydrogenase (short-subunit alcohol dehydrogenase family)
MGRVQDRVAVVTGAANGLGKSIATRLAEEGARLVLGDLEVAGLDNMASLAALGAEAVTVVGDLT